jgi:ubiquinone biosynthesis protein COQ9
MESPSPLEQLRRRLALAVGENAAFDGWGRAAVDSAAGQLGIDPVQARLAMPKTQAGMIDLYIQEVDRALEAWFTPKRLAGMKIREKIRALVWLDDQSEGFGETAAFLDRRIDDVMKFEKLKAEWRGSSDRRLSPSRFLGRLRYPPR